MACGTGNELSLYDRAACQLFGIDRSPAMLEVARQKLGQGDNLRLEDASQMSFASGTFALVTMVLHHYTRCRPRCGLSFFGSAGAGREHFANYRDFMRRRGLPGLVAEQNALVERRFIFTTGIAAIYLLKP